MLTTVLSLAGGDFSPCRAATASRATARAPASRRTIRREPSHDPPAVGQRQGPLPHPRPQQRRDRGTTWTVADRCDGTLTRVTRGVVVVENLRTHRTKVVRAGESFFVARRARREGPAARPHHR